MVTRRVAQCRHPTKYTDLGGRVRCGKCGVVLMTWYKCVRCGKVMTHEAVIHGSMYYVHKTESVPECGPVVVTGGPDVE